VARKNRSDAEYEIGGATKCFKVMEALMGSDADPVTVQTVIERTGFDRNFVDRALKTLSINGYAKRIARSKKWILGSRLLKFSDRFNETCLHAIAKKQ
jgi:DNA-binding IclR family transcriptional regulator